MADLRLRAGFAVRPQVLFFATFGGAWANADLPVTGPGGGSGSADFFGWSVGGGAEVALRRTGAPASTISSPTSIPRR
jgi:opacity protein-like surface antigen